jgi:hypothetical protein
MRPGRARIELLRSGRITYSLLSLCAGTMNCIDATGDITHTTFHPGISWGFKASKAVVRHLSPFFKNGGRINKTVWRMVRWNGCQN